MRILLAHFVVEEEVGDSGSEKTDTIRRLILRILLLMPAVEREQRFGRRCALRFARFTNVSEQDFSLLQEAPKTNARLVMLVADERAEDSTKVLVLATR